MRLQQLLLCAVLLLAFVDATLPNVAAQTQTSQPMQANVEYQYQMYFPRFWGGGYGGYGGFGGYGGYGGYGGFAGGYGGYGGYGGGWGWAGPGLSLGGSLPANSREGISSLYGFPFPAPLGAGVYMNPFGYATRLPGPLEFGLAASSPGAGRSNTAQAWAPSVVPAPHTAAARSPAPRSRVDKPKANVTRTTSLAKQSPDFDDEVSPTPMSELELAAIQRANDIEAYGDVNMLTQQWTQAFVNYRNAVLVSDRADAHVRLGYASAMLQRFSQAAQEFKRGILLDPATVSSGPMLKDLLGPDSAQMRIDLINSVAIWAKEDLKDQDRLFLLGLLLRSNRDGRSTEIIEGAMRLPGPHDHLVVLLSDPIESPSPAPLAPPSEQPKPTPDPPPVVHLQVPSLPELRQEPTPLAFYTPTH